MGLLWAFGGLSIPRLYNSAAKIFGAEDVLCRRLDNLGRNLVYIACGSGCIITTSVLVYFLKKVFKC